MTENVELGSLKADIKETERTKCLNIPRAKVACTDSKVNKRFVVNRVVCDQRRKTNCLQKHSMVPMHAWQWSRVSHGPRTRCVPVCNKSPMCSRCDQLRQSGQLEQGCPNAGGGGGGTCGKFFGRDSATALPGSLPGQSFPAPIPPPSTSLFQAAN